MCCVCELVCCCLCCKSGLLVFNRINKNFNSAHKLCVCLCVVLCCLMLCCCIFSCVCVFVCVCVFLARVAADRANSRSLTHTARTGCLDERERALLKDAAVP